MHQIGKTSRGYIVQPPAQSRVSSEVRLGYSGFSPDSSGKPPRPATTSAQPLAAADCILKREIPENEKGMKIHKKNGET